MAAIECPKCGKSLKVGDHLAGKRVRCPGCQKPFVIPDAPVVEVVEEDEEPEERVTRQPKRQPKQQITKQPSRPSERRPAPRRSRDEEDDEDDDEPRRPRRRRPRDDDDRGSVSFSSAPLVYGILSCLLSCAPLIGFILGSLAMNKANAELDRLPGGKRARAARKQLQLAKTLGVIGMCLSLVMLIVAVVLKITSK